MISGTPRLPFLRSRESDLVTIIEALGEIESSAPWAVLKQHVLDGLVESLERRLMMEASKPEPAPLKLRSLQGQLVWAKKYANLDTLAETFRTELKGVRETIKHAKD